MNNANPNTPPTLLFLHIPKTGGGTLNSIIEKKYPEDRRYVIRRISDNKLTDAPTTLPENIAVVHGHFFYGIHKDLSRPYVYITILRDPIDRMISIYYFVKERPTHPDYASANAMNIVEFFAHQENGAAHENRQTRVLSGFDDPDTPCTEEMFQEAVRNMENNLAVVGLTERFDESLIMIRRVLGWSTPFYYKHNESTRPPKDSFSADTLAQLSQYNQYDLRLYEIGKKVFERQLSQQSTDFTLELRAFKVLNLLYSTPFYAARTFKRQVLFQQSS